MSSILLKPVGEGVAVPIAGDTIIGRNEACDVVLQGTMVSGRHARLTMRNAEVWLEDLASTNGTYVNGVRILEPTRLENGDRVRFDVVEFELVIPPRSEPTRVRDAAAAPQASAQPQPPGAWADPANRPKWKTRLISEQELAEIRSSTGAPRTDSNEPHLQVLSGNSLGKSFALQRGDEPSIWKVGSDPAAARIVFEDPGVSAFHATIERVGDRWKLVDQMSANGTLVNDVKVTIRYLNADDVVKFGPVACAFRVPKTQRAEAGGRRSLRWIVLAVVVVALAGLLVIALR